MFDVSAMNDELDRQGVVQILDRVDDRVLAAAAASAGIPARARGTVYAKRGLLRSHEFCEALRSSGLGAIAEKLLGSTARPVRSILFDKPAGATWSVPWHQDVVVAVTRRAEIAGFSNWTRKSGVVHAEAPASVLCRMLTLRVHLDDVASNDGPLRVIPGSHGERLCEGDLASVRSKTKALTCTGPRGTIWAMRPLLVHSSETSINSAHRRILHVEFAEFELPDPLEWFPF